MTESEGPVQGERSYQHVNTFPNTRIKQIIAQHQRTLRLPQLCYGRCIEGLLRE